jgi:hypothetical protein
MSDFTESCLRRARCGARVVRVECSKRGRESILILEAVESCVIRGLVRRSDYRAEGSWIKAADGFGFSVVDAENG